MILQPSLGPWISLASKVLSGLRHYPKGFGHALARIFQSHPLLADLRGKPEVNSRATDRELFEQQPLGDLWWDAELPQVFFYLLQNKNLQIPDSWLSTMKNFQEEVSAVRTSFVLVQVMFPYWDNLALHLKQLWNPHDLVASLRCHLQRMLKSTWGWLHLEF